MLLIHGIYNYRRTVVAFRNDFCLRCGVPRLAFRHRTFDVLHLFWVPMLPLGFWRRWHCHVCGGDPHADPRTRLGFKWAGVAVLALLSVAFWVFPIDQPDDAMAMWGLRAGGLAATVWAFWATVCGRKPVRLSDHLRHIQPNAETNCPVCMVQLYHAQDGWRCVRCGILRDALPSAGQPSAAPDDGRGAASGRRLCGRGRRG
jgi:hypothetical protein